MEVDEALSRAKEENLDENKINEIVEQIGKKYKLLQSETQRSAADDLESKHANQQLELRYVQNWKIKLSNCVTIIVVIIVIVIFLTWFLLLMSFYFVHTISKPNTQISCILTLF